MGDGDKAEQWAAWAWVIMFNDDMDAWDTLNHDERLRIRLLFGPPADCMSENLELEHTRWKAGAVVRDLLGPEALRMGPSLAQRAEETLGDGGEQGGPALRCELADPVELGRALTALPASKRGRPVEWEDSEAESDM